MVDILDVEDISTIDKLDVWFEPSETLEREWQEAMNRSQVVKDLDLKLSTYWANIKYVAWWIKTFIQWNLNPFK